MVIFDKQLAIYTVFYKEPESEVNKMPNFRARRGKSRKTNVKFNFSIFYLFNLNFSLTEVSSKGSHVAIKEAVHRNTHTHKA